MNSFWSGLLFSLFFLGIHPSNLEPQWGFFGHKLVNRMAVFTLPPELSLFYKRHIGYITDHSVDPDKRRYAVPLEGPRHYIDLDHYGQSPFEDLPREWEDLVSHYTDIAALSSKGDTLGLYVFSKRVEEHGMLSVPYVDLRSGHSSSIWVQPNHWEAFVSRFLLPNYNRQDWTFSPIKLHPLLSDTLAAEYKGLDLFTKHGILPYHLQRQYQMLVQAFRNKDIAKILRYSADIGHYIGDAHVPLHTTSNYNGQFTDQYGIHGFWESRLPELFAEKEYDFFVGKAKYIRNTAQYFWDITLESHDLVDSVLNIEKELSLAFPSDKKYCYEDRLGTAIVQPCFDYSKAYHLGLNGMVEKRMKQTILSIGSIWFSAWIEAGQPKLNESLLLGIEDFSKETEAEFFGKEGTFTVRQHEN
jgi:hypothetical protein